MLHSVEDIIRALQEHPEWREPLLNALLTDQYRQLPTRADRLEEALARLAEESAKTDQRLAEMAARMEESRRETDQRLRELSEKTDQRLAEMAARMEESRRQTEEYLRQLSEKADKRFAEMEARIAESNARVDQRFAEMAARMEESRRETDQRFAEMAARMDESRRQTEEYLRQLSEKADKRFAEMEARIDESNARVDQRFAEMAARMEESRRETDRRFAEMAARMEESRRQTDQRFAEMAARMEESRRQTDQRFAEITSDLRALTETVRNLIRRFDSELGSVKGMTLEMLYRDNATTILGKHFRNLRLVDRGQYLQEMLDQHPITDNEWKQLVSSDVMVHGVHRLTGKEYLMVWEVSWVIDDHDVERAADRAQILRQWQANALPVVAGKALTASAHQAAQERGVLVILDSEVLEQTAPA
jgi:DNA repair exonuclease SbcCD ATPase subunit